MRTRLYLIILGAAIALVAAGCDKLKDLNGSGGAPPFPALSLKGPNTTSSEAHAQQTKGTIEAYNSGFSPTYMTVLSVSNPTQSGDTWTWTTTQGTLTATATATKQNDGTNAWVVKLNGADPFNDTTYNNWVALSGTAPSDNKSGNFNTFRINTTTLLLNAVWTTDTAQKVTATFTTYENGAATSKGIVANNSDGSGELDIYTGAILTYKSIWVKAGTGTWWTYDPVSGNQTGTGTWS